MLLEELEAQSPNSDICDSETNSSDMSDNEYVQSEHSDQEECDHKKLILMEIMWLHQMTVILTVKEGVMKLKMDKFGINYPIS